MIRSAALLPLLAAAPLAAQDGSEPVAWAPGTVITRCSNNASATFIDDP
jgi:hypothetical protein